MYRTIGISKQRLHSMLDHRMKKQELEASLVKMVYRVRKDHPTMSLRSMYYKLKPEGIGRDRFEAMCITYGFKNRTT